MITKTLTAYIRCSKCGVVLCEVVDGCIIIHGQDRHEFEVDGPVRCRCRRCGTRVALMT